MNSLIELFLVDPKYPLYNMIKQLQLFSSGESYETSEARVVVSFQHILAPIFGRNLASVLTNKTKTEKWEGLNGTIGLKCQLSDHAALVNRQLAAAIIRLQYWLQLNMSIFPSRALILGYHQMGTKSSQPILNYL